MKIGGQPPKLPIAPAPSKKTSSQSNEATQQLKPQSKTTHTAQSSMDQAANQREHALSSDFAQLVAQPGKKSANVQERQNLGALVNDMGKDLKTLNRSHESFRASATKMGVLYETLSKKAEEVGEMAAKGAPQDQLFAATQEMQEMNQSFNLQYLQLQQKMQGDNRKFTTLSNVMKTKHDTAKNAINNVR